MQPVLQRGTIPTRDEIAALPEVVDTVASLLDLDEATRFHWDDGAVLIFSIHLVRVSPAVNTRLRR